MQRLLNYFHDTQLAGPLADRIGMEVETSFIDKNGNPISVECSQEILQKLPWQVVNTKGSWITELQTPDGSRVLYELGRQNLELSLIPYQANLVIQKGREFLDQIYSMAESVGAFPYFAPILETNQDLLMIPDERDSAWLKLDGRLALNLLANCSSVQFTFDVSFQQAIKYLAKLLSRLPEFLRNYPQDELWRRYIAESRAGYREDRYGGPSSFESVEDYCTQLFKHDVVSKARLIPQNEIDEYDIGLFIRSVWWYFRLRRYNDNLCVEVRPLPRREDSELQHQLQQVLDCLN